MHRDCAVTLPRPVGRVRCDGVETAYKHGESEGDDRGRLLHGKRLVTRSSLLKSVAILLALYLSNVGCPCLVAGAWFVDSFRGNEASPPTKLQLRE